ncbi:MAG: MATE family efflux transporter [Lachnospiraceae bacterium]|nr:MATE family efflux transporter [Lachnospiraceae bacterium]
MNQTFMKEKPILPLILSMSLPMVLSMMVNSLYNIADSFFVAKISENAMTAIALIFPVQNLINAVTIGFSIGMNAVISFHLGAQENTKANTAATLGFLLNAVHGILLSILCIAVMPVFLRMFTSNPQVIDLGMRYSRIAFSFSVIIASGMSFEKIFQSIGKMTMTMVCMLCGCITNIVLDPVMIFGIGWFPEMGIEGAALATGVGQLVNFALYLIIYIAKPIQVRIGLKYLSFQKDLCTKLYAIGIPSTLNLALPSLLVSSLNVILSAYSQSYVVVLGVYYKLQTFIYLTANGIVQGLRPLVGYNYGAGEYRRVNKLYTTALSLTTAIMLLGTVLCQAIPGKLIGLFTSNIETIQTGTVALRIISMGFIVSSVSVISSGALEGLGMGTPSLVISLLRYIIVIIPAAFLLSCLFGAVGVWHAFWISESLTAIASFFVYRKATVK